MKFRTKLRGIRVNLADRRTERVARRQLSAELAAFQTPAERAELDVILARHTREETREIREILSRAGLRAAARGQPHRQPSRLTAPRTRNGPGSVAGAVSDVTAPAVAVCPRGHAGRRRVRSCRDPGVP
nr:hypothetical protein GCM10020092_048390 [Actinoplanes digitatis]